MYRERRIGESVLGWLEVVAAPYCEYPPLTSLEVRGLVAELLHAPEYYVEFQRSGDDLYRVTKFFKWVN